MRASSRRISSPMAHRKAAVMARVPHQDRMLILFLGFVLFVFAVLVVVILASGQPLQTCYSSPQVVVKAAHCDGIHVTNPFEQHG